MSDSQKWGQVDSGGESSERFSLLGQSSHRRARRARLDLSDPAADNSSGETSDSESVPNPRKNEEVFGFNEL